jgi:DNA-binding response OmpR family regulator
VIKFNKNNLNSFKIILKNSNILYIEDQKNIRENITKALKLVAGDVFSVENAEDSIEFLNNYRIDLIISDINLPNINGIDFIKKIRSNNLTIPVILLSAYTDKDYLLEAAKLKLVDYLVKPINFEKLQEALLKASCELVNNAKFIVDFSDNISYNVMHKRLFNRTSNVEIDLTAKEINLLEYFIENNSRVISHEEIKNEVWDDLFDATDSALKNVLTKLRKKIGKNTITNTSGIGFRINLIMK